MAVREACVQPVVGGPGGEEGVCRGPLLVTASVAGIAPTLELPANEVFAWWVRHLSWVAPVWGARAVRQRRIKPSRPLIFATTLRAVPTSDFLDRLGRAARSCGVHGRPALGSGGLEVAAVAGPGVASRLGSRATTFKGPEGAVLESLAHRAALRRAVCQPQAVGMGRFVWEDVAWSVLV